MWAVTWSLIYPSEVPAAECLVVPELFDASLDGGPAAVLEQGKRHWYWSTSNQPGRSYLGSVTCSVQILLYVPSVSTFPTPPFPEFTSGHSCFSMAAAETLKRFTGSDLFGGSYTQAVPLRVEPTLASAVGTTLNWSTFTDAATEAGESRLYGGIHFYEGNVAGLAMGRKVGAQAFEKAQAYWTGTP